jgi:hypothetical protein
MNPTQGAATSSFHVTVDGFPDDHFRVETFAGHEQLSRAWSFDVVVSVETSADEELERLALARRSSPSTQAREAGRSTASWPRYGSRRCTMCKPAWCSTTFESCHAFGC